MHALWFFFLRKRQFSMLFIVALVLMGTASVIAIPKESAPEVIVPIGIVTTTYPGVSALDMEELITDKLEKEIANLDDIDSVISSSQDGVSVIVAEFDASADIDASIQDLKDAVDAKKSELPRDANDPNVTQVNFANQPIIVLSVSSALPPRAFTELAEEAADTLKGVSGVSDVLISGTREREVQVVVSAALLERYGITLADITASLAQANLTFPVGTVVTDGIEYAIRFEGGIDDVSIIENIPIRSRGGVPVLVRDVARVEDGVERETSISRISEDGLPSQPAFTLSVFKRAGFDVTHMSDAVEEELALLQEEGGLLDGSQVLVVFDQGKNVRKDLTELVKVGFETVALVILCLVLTIGWRESIVAALSIPLSFVIAFIGLYLSGNTINFVSLFALILAIGILVDSGIVITEAIHTRLRKYKDPDEAARAAIREYAWPLIGGTMTTVAVFVPLFFLSGVTGEFIASIPFTIIFVLIASIIVALGMVPLIAIYLTKHSHGNRFEALQDAYTVKAQVWYREKLKQFFANTRAQRIFLSVLTLAFVLSLTLPVTGLLKVIFFPGEDDDYAFIEIETKQGTPLHETDIVLRTVEEILYDKPYVASFTSTAGSGSSFTGEGKAGAKYANLTVTLTEERDMTSAEVADDLRETLEVIQNADVQVFEIQNGPPSGAPVVIKFFGDDLGELAGAVARAETLLASIPGTRDVEPSTKSSATELVLSLDRAKANAAGVSAGRVGEVLRSAVFGVTATTITVNGNDIDIVVRLDVDASSNDVSASPLITLDTIRNLSVPSDQGADVLLGSVIKESLMPANALIAHENEERTESVSAYTVGKTTAAEVVSAFRAREAELELPKGVRISYGGETEDINRSFTEMAFALIAGLILMLAILVLAFNSIRYSLYLLLAVPLSLIGVFVGLALTGQSLSFTSLLGVIALAGVIINHAIILLDSMINYRARMQPHEELSDVVAEASVSRLRPIFLTTLTTVIGMFPLSTISGFWSPLAFAIMFGLTFAMILTLVLVPTLFYRNEKRKLERTAVRMNEG